MTQRLFIFLGFLVITLCAENLATAADSYPTSITVSNGLPEGSDLSAKCSVGSLSLVGPQAWPNSLIRVIKPGESWTFDLTAVPQGEYITPPFQIKCEMKGNFKPITIDLKYPPYPSSVQVVLENDEQGKVALHRAFPASQPTQTR